MFCYFYWTDSFSYQSWLKDRHFFIDFMFTTYWHVFWKIQENIRHLICKYDTMIMIFFLPQTKYTSITSHMVKSSSMFKVLKIEIIKQQVQLFTHEVFFCSSVGKFLFCWFCWGTVADILSSGGTLVNSTTCIGTDNAGFVS